MKNFLIKTALLALLGLATTGFSGAAKPLKLATTDITTEVVELYARQLVSVLAGRPLNPAERQMIAEQHKDALPKLLDQWLSEAYFARSFRIRVETMIGTSGARDGVDFDLPGNLAAYLIAQKLPFSQLLTSTTCIDAQMQPIACDTGAPYSAGVIATRGYLLAHSGRYNLGRANSLMHAFSCKSYPMSSALQPYIPKAELIDTFQIETPEEAKAKGSTGFGNGSTCYVCHGQFSAHTQLFVKFDERGLYQAGATGVQAAATEFGRSDGGLFASHFSDAWRSAKESGNMFGKEVENLAEGAKVLAESPEFLQCMSKNAIAHALSLDSESLKNISGNLLEVITKTFPSTQPSVIELYRSVLSHDLVLKAFAQGVRTQ